MLNKLIFDTIIQWIIFLLIPILVYIIFFRKKEKLTSFLGLKKISKVDNSLLVKLSLISIVYIILNLYWMKKYNLGTQDDRFLSYQASGLSLETILIILIHSIIRTSLLEEIVFRGSLINTFKNKFSFNLANNIQAIVFTGIHILGMLTFNKIDIGLGIIEVYLLSIYFGKITKESGYSIFCSSIFHGLINLIIGIFLIIL